MKFSVIVVALNPGEKLKVTLDSIFAQTFEDYEVILKDGGSRDGSMDYWKGSNAPEQVLSDTAAVSVPEGGTNVTVQSKSEEAVVQQKQDLKCSKVRFFDESDKSIYDAMNQAVSHAKGEFLLFLNCGDTFADEQVLEKTAAFIEAVSETNSEDADGSERGVAPVSFVGNAEGTNLTAGMVLYGDTLGEKNGVVISSPPEITGFACYRNIPCHQSCFYSAELCKEKPYEPMYRIRADYDHFLWCFYRAKAKMLHMGFAVSCYEGGGYSESKENRKRDRREHREITRKYMSGAELFKYKAIMALTLAPLRRALAESKVFSGFYHGLKERLYGRSKK